MTALRQTIYDEMKATGSHIEPEKPTPVFKPINVQKLAMDVETSAIEQEEHETISEVDRARMFEGYLVELGSLFEDLPFVEMKLLYSLCYALDTYQAWLQGERMPKNLASLERAMRASIGSEIDETRITQAVDFVRETEKSMNVCATMLYIARGVHDDRARVLSTERYSFPTFVRRDERAVGDAKKLTASAADAKALLEKYAPKK